RRPGGRRRPAPPRRRVRRALAQQARLRPAHGAPGAGVPVERRRPVAARVPAAELRAAAAPPRRRRRGRGAAAEADPADVRAAGADGGRAAGLRELFFSPRPRFGGEGGRRGPLPPSPPPAPDPPSPP